MKIKRFIGGNLESNGFVIWDECSLKGYIIDPGYQGEKFIKFVEDNKLIIKGILLTHHHYDHTGGIDKIVSSLSCPLMIHINDADFLNKKIDVMLTDHMKLTFGNEEIEVLNSPGHTKGSTCFAIYRHKTIFTGDSIFNVDLGRTDLDGGSLSDMQNSCINIFDKWENDITIYPGHGDPATMKYVRTNNFEFKELL